MDQRSNDGLIKDFSDNGIWRSSNPEVATVDENGLVTIVGPGQAHIDVEVPVISYNKFWTKEMASIRFCVDP